MSNILKKISSFMAPVVHLVIPILIMFGLVFTTKFAFYSEKSENLDLQPLSLEGVTYSVSLREIQMLAVQLSTVLTWVLVVFKISNYKLCLDI